ncbi:neuropilin-1-like [Pomacea canaliculata]|uniref:neuropilin-1-like n=1 Tax=Pomacea canaliculata TaxID=400727 RepID=UPI000D734B57|nr:neuropilin-1-like [Pomacea canaliculata]
MNLELQVENNLLVVVFHSDYSVTGRGFNLVYSVVQADQPGATGDQNLVPFTSPSVSTSITTRFIIPQIETIDVFYPQTGSSGIIKSPGFPSSYTNKLDTTSVVSLDPTRPQLVTFTFDTFDLELCDDCQCDWLEIDVDPAQRFCGDVLDKKSLTVLVQKGSLEVKFHSDYSITGRGFLATYSAVSA